MGDVKPLPISEARDAMPRNLIAAETDKLNRLILDAAKRDLYSIRVDHLCEIKGDDCALTEAGSAIIEPFLEQGYTLHYVYDIRSFVDIGAKLSWDPEECRGP